MRITGEQTLAHPVEQVWDALLDPAVLAATLPGCEQLETLEAPAGEQAYAMTVSAGVATIRGTYDGTCTLSDLTPHESLVMRLRGAGAPGTIDATVQVRFEPVADGTRVSYDADAVVGGLVGGVGQRMLGSVSSRMAAEFFGNVAAALAEGGVRAPAAAPAAGDGVDAASGPAVGQVFAPPPRPAGTPSDFVKGIAVGAGLVLLGVLAGSVLGRRRGS